MSEYELNQKITKIINEDIKRWIDDSESLKTLDSHCLFNICKSKNGYLYKLYALIRIVNNNKTYIYFRSNREIYEIKSIKDIIDNYGPIINIDDGNTYYIGG